MKEQRDSRNNWRKRLQIAQLCVEFLLSYLVYCSQLVVDEDARENTNKVL